MSVLTRARSGIARSGASRSGYPIALGVVLPEYALSGVARSGATRSNYHSRRPFVSIDGVHYGQLRADGAPGLMGLSLSDNLDEAPTTGRLLTDRVEQTMGQEVIVTLGSRNNLRREFAGFVLKPDVSFIGQPSNFRSSAPIIDYTWALNQYKVTGYFTGSATTIIQTLLASYAPAFTYAKVEAGMPTVDGGITFTNEDLTNCLTRTMKRVGGHWRCGYYRDIEAFITQRTSGTPPTTINAVHWSLLGFKLDRDLSQVITRVLVEGGGVNAFAALIAGDTILPLDGDSRWYITAGGVVVCGPQRITYTGVRAGGGGGLVGPGAAPSGAPVLAQASGAGLSDGTRNWAITFVTAAGESIASPLASLASASIAAPTTAPTLGTPTIGTGPNPGSHDYAVSFVTSSGETTPSPIATRATTLTPDPTVAPTPGTPTIGGSVDVGLHDYAVTFETSIGETEASPIGSPVSTGLTPDPASAPSAGAPTIGSGPDPGSHDYAVSFVTSVGETLPGPTLTTATDTTDAPATAPSAGTPTIGSGPDPGTHDYIVTFETSIGETDAGPSVTKATTTTAKPSSAPSSSATPTIGSGPDAGSHDYVVTYTTSIGETDAGPSLTKATSVTPAPATAPTLGTPTIGSGPDPGTHDYVVTFETSIGETTSGPSATKATTLTAAPTTAPTAGGPTSGTGPDLGSHDYEVTFVTSIGETTPSPISGATTTRLISAPTHTPVIGNGAPSFVTSGAWNIGDDVYVVVTYLNSAGETTAGPASNTFTIPDDGFGHPSALSIFVNLSDKDPEVSGYRVYYNVNGSWIGGSNWTPFFPLPSGTITGAAAPGTNTAALRVIPLTSIPLGDANTTARKVYRRFNGTGTFKLVATIPNNTATTYSDTTANSGLGADAPSTSTAYLQRIPLTAIPIGDANVTHRAIYRRFNGTGDYKHVTTIFDNTTTTYTDTVANASLGGVVPTTSTAYLQRIALTAIPRGDANVVARNIYRRFNGAGDYLLVTTLADNTTTTFTDTVPNASLGAVVPSTNTAYLQRIPLTSIPRGDANVIHRAIYRRFNGTGDYKHVTTIFDNTTTTYTDTVANASLGSAAPTTNTAYLQRIPLTAIPKGNADVISRKIYRTVAGGSQLKLLTTIGDNTTTTFNDTVTDASLGANALTASTAYLQTIPLTGIPIGSAEVSNRKLYRRSGGAGLKLLATITDNVTTTYSDTTPNASLGAAPPSVSTAYLQRIALTAIPTGGPLVTQRNLWRTAAGGTQLKLLANLPNNTATTFSDTVTDASLGANAPVANTATANQAALSSIPVGNTGTTARKVYRTVAAGSQLKLVATIADNTTTAYTDSTADGSLGANVPTVDTSGLAQPPGQVLPGATTLICTNVGAFSPTGGYAVIGNGQQVIRYTGVTSSSLTGIPATGNGSITAAVAYNSTVTEAPCLTGIPSSGAGSILYSILKGDPVNILITVNDTVRQAALAALLTTADVVHTGIIEDYIQDRRLAAPECTARGEARLDQVGDPIVTVTAQTRDINTQSGYLLPVNLGAPFNLFAVSFLIQRVDIAFDPKQPTLGPVYTATASSSLYTFEDLLRQRGLNAPNQ